MRLSIVERERDHVKLELRGETETLTGLIADEAWRHGVEAAAVREHPFMEEPKIVASGTNPLRALERTAISLVKRLDELRDEFKRALLK